jgi:hypothetical protein
MIQSSPLIRSIAVTGIALLFILITSCGEKPEDLSGITDFEITKDTIKSETRVNFDLIRVNIPSPGIMAKKLSAAKVSYNKNFLLSTGKRSNFVSNYQKAIGMGAFGADIGLASANNQTQDALDCLDAAGKLAAELGISNAFDPELSKKILSNINKPDTIQHLLDDAFDKAERNLRSNQRVATSVLIVAAGWVEGLYTSVESVNSNTGGGDNTKKIYDDISAHCHAFEYVFQLLDEYKSNADCAKLLQELEPVKTTLLTYGKSGCDADTLPKLREAVTALRNKITA